MSSCSDELPYAKTYFDDIAEAEFIGVIASGFLSISTCIIFLYKAYMEMVMTRLSISPRSNKVSAAERTTNMSSINGYPVSGMASSFDDSVAQDKRKKLVAHRYIQLWGIFPVVSVTAMMTLCIPRTTYVSDLLAQTYMAVCIYNLTSLMVNHFADKTVLYSGIDKVSLRSPPLCCWICCLPKVAVNKQNIARIKFLVLQNVVLCPILSLAVLVTWLDGHYEDGKYKVDEPYPYLSILSAISTLFCIYGLVLTSRLCYGHLNKSQKIRMYLLQITLLVYNLQRLLINVLEGRDIPECRKSLSSKIRAQGLYEMLLVSELFILSIVAACLLKRY